MVHNRFGVPIITHDDLVRNPVESKRTMALWLTGAGLDAADAGLQFVSVQRSLGEAAAATAPDEVAVIEQPAEEVRAAVVRWRPYADLSLRGEDLWAVDGYLLRWPPLLRRRRDGARPRPQRGQLDSAQIHKCQPKT